MTVGSRSRAADPSAPRLGRRHPETGHSVRTNGALSKRFGGHEIRLTDAHMIRRSPFVCLAALFPQGLAAEVGRVNHAKSWRVRDADATVEGPVVRLKPHGDPAIGSHIGLALVPNLKFSDGTLEIDLRGGGQHEASFLGLVFGAADAGTF